MKSSSSEATTSSASSAGSLPVTRPTPLAADQRTMVSLSRRPESSSSMTSSTSSGTSYSSSSSPPCFTEFTSSWAGFRFRAKDLLPRWYLQLASLAFRKIIPSLCTSFKPYFRIIVFMCSFKFASCSFFKIIGAYFRRSSLFACLVIAQVAIIDPIRSASEHALSQNLCRHQSRKIGSKVSFVSGRVKKEATSLEEASRHLSLAARYLLHRLSIRSTSGALSPPSKRAMSKGMRTMMESQSRRM